VGLATAQKVRAPEEEAADAAIAAGLAPALDCLRIAITIYDSAERLTYANQHFDYLFRNLPARATLIGRSYGEIVAMEAAAGEIAPQAMARGADDFVARRRARLTSGDFKPFDLDLADGRIIEIKSRRTPAGGWIALWTDVTFARQSFRRLEDAIALSADAFAFFDRDDRLVVCNKEYASLHGRAVEAMRGATFADLVGGAVEKGRVRIDGDAGDWIQRRIDLHRAAAGAMTLEMKDGTAYLVRDRSTADGHVTVLTDVTDERRVEKALVETKAELASSREQATYLADLTKQLDAAAASADTTKKTLLRTMSHELKTPLNAIIGFSDLLGQMAERFDSNQVREYAGLIHAGGHNLLTLINHILDLTKVVAGKFETRPVRLDAGGAMWIAMDARAERAAAKRLVIDADACPIGLIVEVDENAFAQMIGQLLDNAVAFTPDGGRIVLGARAAGGRVRLSVSDNGPGVAAEDLVRILEPFEQVGRATTDHAAGAGLGLTLVKAFAELHGGGLTIESAPGSGFTATIDLPAAS
jgi:two-component system cell cycle sensor histidine kinase PleC